MDKLGFGFSFKSQVSPSRWRGWHGRVGVAKAKGKAKGKEQPAVGGKGKFVRKTGLPFVSNILTWSEDGTWQYRTGNCMSLPQLFAKCGRFFSAAELYEYYNNCRPTACKKAHSSWGAPDGCR